MKTMKTLFILSLVMVITIVLHEQVFAKRGNGQKLYQKNNIANGESITVSGTVKEIGQYRQGVQIDNGEKVITVYGLGPLWYWEQLNIAYPAVTDNITVNGSKVTFSDGSTKIIALSIEIGDYKVDLRNAESGRPLWRQQNSRGNRYNCPGKTSRHCRQQAIIHCPQQAVTE